ncbi:MAG: DNA repair protein RadC [Desulfobacterales bacterium]|nr:DNA repair protein RadC [Desulfobacterales bacterium]
MTGKQTHKGSGHRKRLRERFLSAGLSGFQDYEVLELLLSLNTPRKDTKQAAKDLIKEFKTFHRVLEASTRDLCRINGVGPANSFGIRLIKAAADRYLETRILDRDVVKDPDSLLAFLNQIIGYKDREHFVGIFLDAKNRVTASEILFTGSLTASAVYPREVIIKALDHKAASVIFAHNHPSGDIQPSKQDIRITRTLSLALKFAGINVHDHIITGSDGFYSFAGNGRMAKFSREFEQLNERYE